MEELDFSPTPEQRRFFEGGERRIWMGQRSGRRHATEILVVAQAANAEEARLCLEDLHTKGFCLQTSDGRRVEPRSGGARIDHISFDEEEKKS
jgi:hypothetical protein